MCLLDVHCCGTQQFSLLLDDACRSREQRNCLVAWLTDGFLLLGSCVDEHRLLVSHMFAYI